MREVYAHANIRVFIALRINTGITPTLLSDRALKSEPVQVVKWSRFLLKEDMCVYIYIFSFFLKKYLIKEIRYACRYNDVKLLS